MCGTPPPAQDLYFLKIPFQDLSLHVFRKDLSKNQKKTWVFLF